MLLLTGLINSLNLKVESMAGMKMARSTWTDEFESATGEVHMSVCDGVPKLPLPRYLREHREEILHIFDDSSGPDYNPEGWRGYLHNNPVVAADLDTIIQKCPVKISRKDVCGFAHNARSGSYPDIRRLFLVCMIWGYNRDPNGLPNTERALSDPRAEEVLKRTASRISNGEIREAYDGFRLARCGPAFFTKFFYFVGKEWQIRPLPLVLDRHIAESLRALGEEEGWQSGPFAKVGRKGYVKRYSEGYVRYICSMDEWATELGCLSDNVEYFMYLKDKDRAHHSTKPKEVHMANRKKAREINDKWMSAAKPFCKAHNLEREFEIIGDMDWPPTWHLSKGGGGPRDYTERQFQYAVRGSLEAMFHIKGMTTRPADWWEEEKRWGDRFGDYLRTAEGQSWRKKHDPPWARGQAPPIPSRPSNITARLSIDVSDSQYAELGKLGGELGVTPEVLAKIWILGGLHHLR